MGNSFCGSKKFPTPVPYGVGESIPSLSVAVGVSMPSLSVPSLSVRLRRLSRSSSSNSSSSSTTKPMRGFTTTSWGPFAFPVIAETTPPAIRANETISEKETETNVLNHLTVRSPLAVKPTQHRTRVRLLSYTRLRLDVGFLCDSLAGKRPRSSYAQAQGLTEPEETARSQSAAMVAGHDDAA